MKSLVVTNRSLYARLALLCFSFFLMSCDEWNETYPTRPIKNTVVWSAGGGTDIVNRLIMGEMSKLLNQQIDVENKTGGLAGSVGLHEVYSQPADGYSLVGISESNVTAAVNGGWLRRFDVWSPYIVGGSPDLISVKSDSPYKSLAELVAAAKSKPETIKAAASGAGSIHHLNLLALMKGTQTKLVYVRYRGSSLSQDAVLSGEADLVITSLSEQAALIKAGKLRPLAMLTPEDFEVTVTGAAGGSGKLLKIESAFSAFPQLKDYLPLKQAIGFAVRKDAPEPVKARLSDAFEAAMASDAVKTWAKENHYVLSGKHGQEAIQLFSNLESLCSWTLHDLGAAKLSPQKFNIPRP